MQNRGKWILWGRFPDQDLSNRRGCGNQKGPPGQALQGELQLSSMPWLDYVRSVGLSAELSQNRELQIMRIVRHPNIVELKAFYYSNGERVSFFPVSPYYSQGLPFLLT